MIVNKIGVAALFFFSVLASAVTCMPSAETPKGTMGEQFILNQFKYAISGKELFLSGLEFNKENDQADPGEVEGKRVDWPNSAILEQEAYHPKNPRYQGFTKYTVTQLFAAYTLEVFTRGNEARIRWDSGDGYTDEMYVCK